MIYSPSRAKDIKWRLELLEKMLDAFNNNCPITAKEIGKTTKWLNDRILTRDYTEDDRTFHKVQKMEKLFTMKTI